MLVAVEPTGEKIDRSMVWQCRCDCGKYCDRSQRNLRNGRTTSCGCKRMAILTGGKPYHGKASSRTYRIWSGMQSRCFNPRVKEYKYYGGRGITVCERWRDFRLFLQDMGEIPPGLSIDRINNDGNYEPGNCKWSTAKEQANNRRRAK